MHHSIRLRHPAPAAATRVRLASLLLGATSLTACDDTISQPDLAAAPAVSASVTVLRSDSISGSYIVRFRDDVKDPHGLAKQLVGAHGGRMAFTYSASIKGFAVANLPPQALAALQRNPNVTSIEADRVVRISGTQYPTPSWGLDRIDQTAAALNSTYDFPNDGAGVNAYILDSGIRTTHTDFGGRAVGGFTSIADGNGSGDCNGHGTHVAGTVGGTQYGVAKGVKLWAVRVLDCAGSGTYSGVIAGIDWVTANRVLPAVANMSLGGPVSSAVNAAVQASIKAGVVYAIAAGNNGADACDVTPASTPEAITVGSSGSGDAMSGFSNRGPCVDILAPGEGIISASHGSDGGAAGMSGTSMAAPHAAGVAALILASNRTASPAQVASLMTGGATSGVLTGLTTGTVNLLLNTRAAGGSTAPLPPDTTATPTPAPPPPPPPPAVDAAPTANFTASCPRGRCTLDGSASVDDRGITEYRWDFGDGSPSRSGSTLSRLQYRYSAAGTYTVTLVVTDTAGQTSTRRVTVSFKRL